MKPKKYSSKSRIGGILLCVLMGGTPFSLLNAEGASWIKEERNFSGLLPAKAEDIRGKAVDENGEPMIGVSILVKGTTTGTVTDVDGNFSLSTKSGDVLVFSYIGYLTQNVTLGAESTLEIKLVLDTTNELDEVVVVGYGTQSKRSMTGAEANMKADKIQEIPSSNLSQYPNLEQTQRLGRGTFDPLK